MLNNISQIKHYLIRGIYLVISILIFCSLISYSHIDNCFNVRSNYEITNVLGIFGSHLSDFLLQLWGYSSILYIIIFFSWAVFAAYSYFLKIIWRVIFSIISINILSLLLNFLPLGSINGGMIGAILHSYFLKNVLTITILFLIFIVSIVISIGISPKYLLYLLKKIRNISLSSSKKNLSNVIKPEQKEQSKISKILKLTNRSSTNDDDDDYPKDKFRLPSVDLLQNHESNIQYMTQEELRLSANDLLKVLNDFGIEGKIIGYNQGPVVTLYEFEPISGTKSSRVIGVADDIARSLSAISARIAVMKGRNALSIELPNQKRIFFGLNALLNSNEYNNKETLLPIILGNKIDGSPCIVDLAKMPHLLVAGTTGSGKSVAINSMILSLLYKYTPTQCQFIMIDPKMVELSVYDNIPHLLTPVVTQTDKAITALKWAVKEMEDRYRLMASLNVRNINNFNNKVLEAIKNETNLEKKIYTGFDSETGKPVYDTQVIEKNLIPYIVVIVDEMADLMLVAGKEIEALIQRLSQMARAAGIHLIMSTQRPSVDIITGVIKSNFPSRISFKVASKIDSRTILGAMGAEQLLGKGDMLYLENGNKIFRVHGPFVDDDEIEKIADYLKSQGRPNYIANINEEVKDQAVENDPNTIKTSN